MSTMPAPSKQNILYLPIKQIYFDAIVAGDKKQEYREIKETTFSKYLEMWHEDGDSGLVYDDEKIDCEPQNDICIWNGGVYPYYPREYDYLNLAVGYGKERDTALVEITDISFEPLKDKKGEPCRFFWSEEEGFEANAEGDLCVWQVVYHLGKIVDLKRK